MIATGSDKSGAAGSDPECASSENAPISPPARADSPPATPKSRADRRLSWPELMRRVFALDVLSCPRCAGRMRIMAAICGPEAKDAILQCLGLPPRAPPIAAPKADEPYEASQTPAHGFTSDYQAD